MTTTIKGNAQGGVVEANGIAAANITSGTGIPFMKNKLINGEVTRINQRGVANWAAVSNGNYGYDRWKKVDASNMTQIIEAGNFRPNTVHTLSGIGVTTQQITSPASGNWTLPNIPIAAVNVQVEEGLEATPFEVRHIQMELALCQRYYQLVNSPMACHVYAAGSAFGAFAFNTSMRVTPTLSPPLGVAVGVMTVNGGGTSATTSSSLGAANANGGYMVLVAAGLVQGDASLWINYLTGFSAEL